jgi:hypothetical protein
VVQQRRRAQDQQARRDVAELERRDRHQGSHQPGLAQGAELEPRAALLRADRPQPPCLGGGDGDRDRGEEPRHRREIQGVPDTEPAHQPGREQRSHDRAEIVAGALEPVGTAVGLRRRQLGEHGVAGRCADTAGEPGTGACEPGLPHRCREADRAGRRGRDDVAAGGHPQPPLRIVGERPGDELRDTGERVADPLDHAERAGRGTQGDGHERRQHRRGDLVTGIAEEAREADAADAARQPAVPRDGLGSRLSCVALYGSLQVSVVAEAISHPGGRARASSRAFRVPADTM